MKRADDEILKDVFEELRVEPSLRDDDVAVSLRDGVVTLAGFVDSYADKWKAERLVSRVKGVRAVANDIEVKLPTASQRPDPDIARAALDALEWNVLAPADRIQVKVDKGWVTLDGSVDWQYQREAAERAVRYLKGVKGVTNLITLREHPTPRDIKARIKQALARSAQLDADRIQVEVDGHKVILRGTVHAHAELEVAEQAAWKVRGVTEVETHLTVEPGAHAPT